MRKTCVECGREFDGHGHLCPECSAKHPPVEVDRRSLLVFGANALGGAIALGYLGLAARYLYPRSETGAKMQDVGAVGQFPVGTFKLVDYTGSGYQDGVWVGNLGNGEFKAFDFHCTHLQCPVAWNDGLQRFMCPCHGSQFTKDGVHVAGPAPRGLFQHKVLVQDGRVLIGGIVA